MWNIFKVPTELVTILLLSYVLFFWPPSMWNLNSPKDGTHTPYVGRQSLNHQATGKSLIFHF